MRKVTLFCDELYPYLAVIPNDCMDGIKVSLPEKLAEELDKTETAYKSARTKVLEYIDKNYPGSRQFH